MKISDFGLKKQQKKKISMVTCYDYTSALIASASDVDSLLVGDSAAMVMHGFNTTVQASVEMMRYHTAAVVRATEVARNSGALAKFVVADLPFLSYRKDLSSNVAAAGELMQTGAHAVKLEGAKGNLELISHLVDSGIPVMGHLGLTPQSINQLGGFKVQGRLAKEQEELIQAALALQKAGCFSLVLECIPAQLATQITNELHIPTIGIGAGVNTDGQVLVWQDLLGMNPNFNPKFVKKYWNGFEVIKNALNEYHNETLSGKFPTAKESYE